MPKVVPLNQRRLPFAGHNQVKRSKPEEANAWKPIKCGHCGYHVSAAVIGGKSQVLWLECNVCGHPSSTAFDEQFPAPAYGDEVEGLPGDTEQAYAEARRCMQVNAFTAAALLCRKILMHVAVEKGAKKVGDTFKNYIQHLETEGYVTPTMKDWVNSIKDTGNDATHKLEPASKENAENVLDLTEMLLKLVYETASKAKKHTHDATTQGTSSITPPPPINPTVT